MVFRPWSGSCDSVAPMLPVVWLALAIAGNGADSVKDLGVIEGALLFPACDLPTDLEVCVEQANGKLRCTSDLVFEKKTIAYRIEVPAGKIGRASCRERV